MPAETNPDPAPTDEPNEGLAEFLRLYPKIRKTPTWRNMERDAKLEDELNAIPQEPDEDI